MSTSSATTNSNRFTASTHTLPTDASGLKKMTSSGSKAVEQPAGQQKPTPWSRASINPVTQRASGSPVQNGVRSNGPPQSNAPKASPAPAKDNGSADKMTFLLANMKGLNVTLTLKNGDRYSGIFSAVSDGRYIIKMAKRLPGHGKQANGVTDETVGSGADRVMSISVQDVVDLAAQQVRLDKAQKSNGASNSFRTDTDISAGWQARERQLQKWDASGSATDSAFDMSLGNGSTGDFDQFATHRQMTGLESTYDENNYTTRLDRSKPGFEEAARKADRIAREIENSAATNAHIAEERGMKPVDDSGLDEEAKYSGVQRDFKPLPPSQPNRYTPPAMRAPTGQPTVPGAPVDPAIIEATFADSTKPHHKSLPLNNGKPVKPEKSEKPATPADQSAAPAKQDTSLQAAGIKPAATERPNPQVPGVKPVVPAAIPAVRGTTKEGGATATVERDVHEAFKEFNKSEKLRVQEVQRNLARRDKAVKLNDLKKFAQNFKLHTEVPADLLPILARDEKKQIEIKEKAKKNAEDIKSTPPRSTATSAAATPAEAKPVPKQAAPAARNETGPSSPIANNERPPQQQQRSRQPSTNMGSNGKGQGQHAPSGQGQPHRQHGNLGQRLMNAQMNRGPQPMHSMPMPDPRLVHPNMAAAGYRWDPTKSFIPNATSKAFTPGSNPSSGSSPTRVASNTSVETKAPTPGNLFEGRTEGRKGPIPPAERVSFSANFNVIVTLKKEAETLPPEGKKAVEANGGIVPSYRTPPTWDALVPETNREKTYKDMFPNSLHKPAASPQHPGPSQFQHQLPHGQPYGYMQQQPMGPNQTPRHMIAQPHHGQGTPGHFEEAQRMQYSHSMGGVQPSPRPSHIMYNPQGPPPGQQYPTMVYGTSPGGYGLPMNRQLSNTPQFYPQPGQMVATQAPPGAYIAAPMPGQMMAPNGQPFFPHGAHMAPQPGANGFPSPANRPVMMVQQNSQSGHSTPQVMTPYFQPQGPVPQMRYSAPQPHPQYPGNPQHFGQPQMRGGPHGGNGFPQPMMGAPQGMMMPAGQMPPDADQDGK